MKVVRVELQDSIQDFKNCYFSLNKETGCFEVYHIDDMICYRTVVGIFPKEHVIGIYYYDKENK